MQASYDFSDMFPNRKKLRNIANKEKIIEIPKEIMEDILIRKKELGGLMEAVKYLKKEHNIKISNTTLRIKIKEYCLKNYINFPFKRKKRSKNNV